MKNITKSLLMITAVAAIVIGGSMAYFSDTETSTGNTFTAGSIDLKVDSTATYNGVAVPGSTWALKDLDPTSDKFFNFADVKPGDVGENTISLHVYDNPAWVCASVANLTNLENGLNEPEALADTTTGANDGELQNALRFTIWRDADCQNDFDVAEDVYLVQNVAPVDGTWPVYDSTTGAPLAGDTDACLGVAWTLPVDTGNEVQSDSMTGDISFYVEQARNNTDFRCVPQEEPKTIQVTSSMMYFGSTGWAGWSCPTDYPNIVTGTTDCAQSLANSLAWKPGASVGAFTYPTTPFGYSYAAGEEGWIVQDGGDGGNCHIILTCQAD